MSQTQVQSGFIGDNAVTTAKLDSTVSGALVPIGGIIMWSGSVATIPSSWRLCNGANGTPNLQDRFIVGAGSGYAVAATGGSATVTLDTTQMPQHSHGGITSTQTANHRHVMPGDDALGSGAGGAGWVGISVGGFNYDARSDRGNGQYWLTGYNDANHQHGIPAQGGGLPHQNLPPYYALHAIKLVVFVVLRFPMILLCD